MPCLRIKGIDSRQRRMELAAPTNELSGYRFPTKKKQVIWPAFCQ